MDENVAEEEVVDIVDLLATQSEEIDEHDDEIDLDTDDVEVLKERIAKRNKALKKSKQAIHRLQESESTLLDRMEQLESKFNSSQSTQSTGDDDRKREEALAAWRESVSDDPSKSIDFAMTQINDSQGKMVDYLATFQDEVMKQIAELKGDMNPEKQKYREKIATLKTNPELADQPDDVLLKMVKALEGANNHPRGPIGGKRATATKDPAKELDELKERYRKQMGNS